MMAIMGPELPIDVPAPDAFDAAQHTPFVVPAAMASLPLPLASLPTPQTSPRTDPPPNPPFVFPSRPASLSGPIVSSAPPSFSRSTGRRPAALLDPSHVVSGRILDAQKRNSGSPALPAFSFNPGASLPSSAALSPAQTLETSFLSPPQSPSTPASAQPAANRPTGHGHRRGGSEFVGGKLRNGDSITVTNSSPTKSESGMASPSLAPADFRPRRGHAHRRSAAISSHDLSSIMMPLPGQALRGSSAPNSPAVADSRDGSDFPSPGLERPTQSEPSLTPTYENGPSSVALSGPTPAVQLRQPARPQARNRVGFSDTLEFIPRPLSVISSDTSSTVTARPGGHSVSNSISSIVSGSNTDRELPSPLGLALSRMPSEPRGPATEDRPSTAGAVLERSPTSPEHQLEADTSPRRRVSIPDLTALPPPGPITPITPTTPSPTKAAKRWSFFGLDPFAVVPSPSRSRPASSSSAEAQSKPSTPRSSAEHKSIDASKVEEPTVVEKEKPCPRKKAKKPKKVKTWAGSILSRKSKARKAKRRTPTPSPLPYSVEDSDGDEDESGGEMAFEPESVPTLLVTESTVSGGTESWSAPRPVGPDDDTPYPMIDLDAALGPFNTPLPRNPEWEASQKAGGHVKRQLHSAAGMSRFTGPGMHYQHRRTESAPEMVPFDTGRLGFPRFASSSTMADVFEEEEEEEDEGPSKPTSSQPTPVIGTPVIQPTRGSDDRPVSRCADTQGSSLLSLPRSSVPSLECDNAASRKESVVQANADPTSDDPAAPTDATDVPVNESVFSQTFKLDDIRLPTPTYERPSLESPSPRQIMDVHDFAPAEVPPFSLPPASTSPVSPCSMGPMSGPLPSPRSPVNPDTQRLSTAPAAAAEDNFHSLLMGEPGPEVRLSIDIPSLTSSTSTMTRESNWTHHAQPTRQLSPGAQPRPASFSAMAFGRRRSSLASLSRLISSAHGERSKLSVEVTVDAPEQLAKTKVSKTKRLSRMMQFWKPKDNLAA